jgi:hypothetical protein
MVERRVLAADSLGKGDEMKKTMPMPPELAAEAKSTDAKLEAGEALLESLLSILGQYHRGFCREEIDKAQIAIAKAKAAGYGAADALMKAEADAKEELAAARGVGPGIDEWEG